MVGTTYNPNDCAFLLSQSLNSNQFNSNVPYSSNRTTHNVLWDFIAQKIYWVNTINGLIEAEISSLNIITTNYESFYNSIINSELKQGFYYRITDYKSVNFLNGFNIANNNPVSSNPNFVPRQIHTGNEEVIVVQAINEKTISPIAYSETYPQDIIQYSPLANKIGLSLNVTNGFNLPNGNLITGFDLQWDAINNEVYFEMPNGYPLLYGQRLYLTCLFFNGIDNLINEEVFDVLVPGINVASKDYAPIFNPIPAQSSSSRIRIDSNQQKVVLIDLDYNYFLDYVSNTLFVQNVYEIGNAYGHIQQRYDTINNIKLPCDFRGYRYRRFEVDLSPVNPYISIGYWGQGDDYYACGTTGNFKDFPIFQVASNIAFESINATPRNSSFDNVVVTKFFNNVNIKSLLQDSTFVDFISTNFYWGGGLTINQISGNDINGIFQDSIINVLDNNSLKEGLQIYCNDFSRNISQLYVQGINARNVRDNNLKNFYGNTLSISKDFESNIILQECNSNTFPNNVIANRINYPFSNNIFNTNNLQYLICDYGINGVDFSASTIIYQNGVKNIIARNDFSTQIVYVDSVTNNMVYNNVNF